MNRDQIFRDVPILAGFLSTLLQDTDGRERDSGEPGSDDTIWTCPDATFNAAADICRRFLAAPDVGAMLVEVLGRHALRYAEMTCAEADDVGNDLYLTVAGHGAGFWDGDWKPHGDALTEAAQEAYKACCLSAGWGDGVRALLQSRPADMFTLETYICDDGHVYICGREG